MIFLRRLADQWMAVRADLGIVSLREQTDIAAGNDDPGMLIAEQHPLTGKEFTLDIAAADLRVTGAVRAAETGNTVAFSMDPDDGATDVGRILTAEGADTGADVTTNGDGD